MSNDNENTPLEQSLRELEGPAPAAWERMRRDLAGAAERSGLIDVAFERHDSPLGVGDVLVGTPGSPGTGTGRARVLLSSRDPGALEPGDVLVAPGTDPSWTPLFVPAAAVVVDVGAMLSHAVIVSRELGLPCVVSVTGATRTIADGALVEVDGAAGTVTILEAPPGRPG